MIRHNLFTGISLLFIPFQPLPALKGATLTIAFTLINIVEDKMRLWSGVAWIIVAGIIMAVMLKGKEAGEKLRVLITVFALLTSAWDSIMQYRKKSFPLLIFRAVITPDNLWPSPEQPVNPPDSSISCFLPFPVFATGVRAGCRERSR